ncbi:hypothetical protein ACS0TY_016602 [Phlomoides rotata]
MALPSPFLPSHLPLKPFSSSNSPPSPPIRAPISHLDHVPTAESTHHRRVGDLPPGSRRSPLSLQRHTTTGASVRHHEHSCRRVLGSWSSRTAQPAILPPRTLFRHSCSSLPRQSPSQKIESPSRASNAIPSQKIETPNRISASGCGVSPRVSQRSRRRLEQGVREKRDIAAAGEKILVKPRKKRATDKSKKDKSITVASRSMSIDGDGYNPDVIGEIINDLVMWKDFWKILSEAKRKLGEILSTFEFLDIYAMDLVLKHLDGLRDPLPSSKHNFYILIETTGSTESHDK